MAPRRSVARTTTQLAGTHVARISARVITRQLPREASADLVPVPPRTILKPRIVFRERHHLVFNRRLQVGNRVIERNKYRSMAHGSFLEKSGGGRSCPDTPGVR